MANRHKAKMTKISTGGTVRTLSGNKNVLREAQSTETKKNIPSEGGLSGNGIGRKRGGSCKGK